MSRLLLWSTCVGSEDFSREIKTEAEDRGPIGHPRHAKVGIARPQQDLVNPAEPLGKVVQVSRLCSVKIRAPNCNDIPTCHG